MSTEKKEETKTHTPTAQITVLEKNIADQVLERINAFQEAGQLLLPKDYHAGNALKAAFLILRETVDSNKKPVLEVCSKESIAFALQKMIVLGLNPLKKQCDFIAYGTKLQCDLEYTANVALAKRYGMKDIFTNVIYKDDVFKDGMDLKTGRTIIVQHDRCSIEKRTKENLIGCYAVVTMEDGTTNVEIMNTEMVKDSWSMGGSKGNSPAHTKFPDQMYMKTVSNRATKPIIRGSDDAGLFTDDNDRDTPATTVANLNAQKENAKASVETIAFDEVPKTENKTEESTELSEKEKEEIAKEEAEEAQKQQGGNGQTKANF